MKFHYLNPKFHQSAALVFCWPVVFAFSKRQLAVEMKDVCFHYYPRNAAVAATVVDCLHFLHHLLVRHFEFCFAQTIRMPVLVTICLIWD